MAGSTVLGGGTVEQHRFPTDHLRHLVALSAAHIAMGSLQRKTGAPVVIEKRGFPARAVVALGAGREWTALSELPAMNVVVALFAGSWGDVEIHIDEASFEGRRPMARLALHGAMRSHQRKGGGGVVEAHQVAPRLRGMADLATVGSVWRRFCHALAELPLMGVGVATGTRQALPVIYRRGLPLDRSFCSSRHKRSGCAWLVAVVTGHRDVAAGQHKAGLLVLGQREGGWPITSQRVALLAAVEVGSGCELSLVLIGVAVQAALELELVQSVSALGNMALLATNLDMFPLQRIGGRLVLLERKKAGLEAIYGMTGSTLTGIGALDELSAMWIRLVAVHAFGEDQRLLEIAVSVALQAVHRLVFALQRVSGPGVIEVLSQGGGGNVLPSTGVVTSLAALRKTAVMRIAVAVVAFAEGQADVAGLGVGTGAMAFLTRNPRMQTGERITSLGVVEL